MWSDPNALQDAISMTGEDEFSQRAKSFIHKIGQGTVSFTDAEFAMLKRFVERRGRDAAHVTVAPVDTAQYCYPRSPSPEISLGVRVCNMEKHEEGRVDPEPDQLESPPAGTGFETPGQQCHSILETRRTTANGCLLVAVSSNFGRNTFSRAEIAVGRRADSESTTQYTASITASLQTRRKPKDKETGSEENKQFDPGGERRGATTLESGCTGIVFFPGGNLGLGARCLCFVLLSVRVCLYIV